MGVLQVCIVGVLWGSGGLAVKLMLRGSSLSVLTVSAWRTGVAAIALWIWTIARGRTGDIRQLWSEKPVSVVLAGVGTAISQALYFGGIVEAGVPVATIISLGLAPVLLTVWEALRERQAPARGRAVAVTVALVGLTVVAVGGGNSGQAPHAMLGVVLSAGSAVMYALATAAARPALGTATPTAMATLSFTAGAVVQVPALLLAGAPYTPTSLGGAGWLLYLSVISLALGYSVFYSGLSKVPGSVAVLGTLLQPVTSAVAAAIVLDERLGAAGVLGTLLILASVSGIGLLPARGSAPPARS